MAFVLSPETEKLIEAMLPTSGVKDADELVRLAIQLLPKQGHKRFEELDEDTQSSIRAGLAEAAAGQTRPWEEVREELRSRFIER